MMSDYHVLESDRYRRGKNFIVVFHIPVPDQDNEVGVNLRTALSEMRGTVPSRVPANRLGAGEQAALDAGELYEHFWTYRARAGMTLIERRDELDTKFTALSGNIVGILMDVLAYWGYSRDVP